MENEKKNHIFGYFKFVQDEKYFGIELWGYVYLWYFLAILQVCFLCSKWKHPTILQS